jgi:hypothetical protein
MKKKVKAVQLKSKKSISEIISFIKEHNGKTETMISKKGIFIQSASLGGAFFMKYGEYVIKKRNGYKIITERDFKKNYETL